MPKQLLNNTKSTFKKAKKRIFLPQNTNVNRPLYLKKGLSSMRVLWHNLGGCRPNNYSTLVEVFYKHTSSDDDAR